MEEDIMNVNQEVDSSVEAVQPEFGGPVIPYDLDKEVTPSTVCVGGEVTIKFTIKALYKLQGVTITDTLANGFTPKVPGSNIINADGFNANETKTFSYIAIAPNTAGTNVLVNQKVVVSGKYFDYGRFNDFSNTEYPQNKVNVVVCPVETPCCNEYCESFTIQGDCNDKVDKAITINQITCQGRLLKLTITIPNVCKNRKLAVGIFLEEKTGATTYIDRGFRILEVERTTGTAVCENLVISEICFLIPGNICSPKDMRIHVLANYLDFDFVTKPCLV